MQLSIPVYRLVNVTKEVTERLLKASSEKLCVACMEPLDDSRTIRGCHQRCYKATKRCIERGVWTEEQRVAEGKLLKADPGGRPAFNPVSKEAAKAS